MTSHVIAYRSLELLFGTHAFHFNCFFEDCNCVFTQIRCLSRVLLIRHMFPNYNRLFYPNCKLIFFKYQWLLTPKLSCLSQHTGEIIMSVIDTHCRCDIPWIEQSDQGYQFYKRLKPIFSTKWAFVQWDIVLVGFCPSGLLSVPQRKQGPLIQCLFMVHTQLPKLKVSRYLTFLSLL